MIAEFYENREIFLTGGSGVVGKGIIDKLLRSCNVRKIYMLLRPKKSVSIEERLQKLKKAKIFCRLHREKPTEFDEKICVIPGDVTEHMLGITAEYAKLMENVSVVFHSAATVRFDEVLRDAITLNVAGTLETIKFAENLKNLKVFLYVSTFYSNPYLKYVEPKVYDAPMDWKFCLELTKRTVLSDEMIDIITKKLIVGFPNTYCFTKNVAESLVNEYRHKLPIAIYRPSIVVFAVEDPEPGYSPTLMGATGVFALTGAGILKGLYIAKDQRLDLCPKDLAIKAMLYYGVKTAQIYAESRPRDIPVFMVSTYGHCSITLPKYIGMIQKFGFWNMFAFEKNFLVPGCICTESRLYYNILVFFKQLLPSVMVDGILRLCGRQPAMLKVQRKLYSTLETMKPFLFNNYESPGISCITEMLQKLGGTDFNMTAVRYGQNYYVNVSYVTDMIRGIREILFKEDPATLPRSRMIIQFKILLHRMAQIFVVYKLYTHFLPVVTNWLERAGYNNSSTSLLDTQ